MMMQLFQKGKQIDPDAAFEGLAPLIDLDSMGLYGSNIWILYKDICGESILNLFAVLRGNQLGFISAKDIFTAVENSRGPGKNIPFDIPTLLKQVQRRLPAFGATGE